MWLINFILFVALFGGFIWLFMYFLAAMSKVSNRKISYRGDSMTNPDDFDNMTQDLKKGGQKVINVFKKLGDMSKTQIDQYKQKKIQNLLTTGGKIEQLKKLEELKASGTITPLEFDVIKSEILK